MTLRLQLIVAYSHRVADCGDIAAGLACCLLGMPMMHIRALVLILTASVALGCAPQRIELTAAPGQESMIRDGMPALISRKQHLVMLRPNKRLVAANARPAFTIAVRNFGNQPVTLYESGVSAQQPLGAKTAAIRVYRYDELVKEEQTRQAVAAVGAALGGFSRAYSASNAGYVNTTGSFNAYGNRGSAYGTYSATTYDPLRAQLAQNAASAQTASEFAMLQAQGEQNLQALEGSILKDNTVLPGEWYGGVVVLDSPTKPDQGATNYTLHIDFAGEQHVFSISQVAS